VSRGALLGGSIDCTLKMVRGRIEKHYADRIAELHRADGAKVCNARNRAAIAAMA
jgi:hypothetical protein